MCADGDRAGGDPSIRRSHSNTGENSLSGKAAIECISVGIVGVGTNWDDRSLKFKRKKIHFSMICLSLLDMGILSVGISAAELSSLMQAQDKESGPNTPVATWLADMAALAGC